MAASIVKAMSGLYEKHRLCYCRLKALVSTISEYSTGAKNKSSFVDYLQMQVYGGAGGQGLPKFGGFGGDGGQVIIMANQKVKTLKRVLKIYPRQICRAGAGENSDKFHLLGDKGTNLHINVPVGVIVHHPDGKTVDLNKDGDICIAAEGGKGGNSNTKFLGLKGERNLIGLELKLLADVGLIGFPNAGKSTFLKAISSAKPRIAAYPFTTISPQLGIMDYEDGRKISVADLPGLIEGAHQNYGMGIRFLRHAERTKLLLYVLDINDFQLSTQHPERTAFETLLLLMQELDEYGHGMVEKPSILTLNKIDTDKSGHMVKKLTDLVKNLPDSLDQVSEDLHPTNLVKFDDVIPMAAMKHENILTVKNRIREVMDDYAEQQKAEELSKRKSLMQIGDDLSTFKEQSKTILV